MNTRLTALRTGSPRKHTLFRLPAAVLRAVAFTTLVALTLALAVAVGNLSVETSAAAPAAASTTPDPNAIQISLPAQEATCGTRFSSQDVWPGTTTSLAPPGGGHPTVWQRIDASNLDFWRVQAVDGHNNATTSLVSPAPYTGTDGRSVKAWDFTALDKVLADGPSSAVRELDMTMPPDALWTGTGPLVGTATPGALADQSFEELAAYYANIVRYFRTGILVTNEGASVSYTASSLTDTSKDFSAFGGGGYAVTATVLDAKGFPDWETATVTGVSNGGHTLALAWPKGAPAAGAAYNLASTTPPITSPVNATPWPRPPAVGDVAYFELFNEPDLSQYTYPRTSPALPPPTPSLTAVNISGGSLVPGTTYAYRLTALNIAGAQSLPGTQVSITLPAGTNAVRIDWSPTSNLGLAPFAYRIYGRSTTSTLAMVVVGRDAASGLTWTDKGGVSPSGALPTSDGTPGFQVWRAHEYTRMWNTVAPAMKAVDPSIRLLGPTASNPISLAKQDVVTTAVTTGPGDRSHLSSDDYVPVLMASATPKPDVVSMHSYGWYQGKSSTEAQEWNGLSRGINDFLSRLATAVGQTPVWLDEMNVDAGFMGSTDYRAGTQMGSAYLADSYLQWCKRAPQIAQLFQYEVANGDPAWQFISTRDAPSNCTPQPSCLAIKASQPNLEYWLMQRLNLWFPAGGALVPVANVPSGIDAFAVQNGNVVSVIVVNKQIGATPGLGVSHPGLAVQLLGGTVASTQQVVIDGSTDMLSGPTVTDLGSLSEVTDMTLAGYGVSMFRFTLSDGGGDTIAPSTPSGLATVSGESAITLSWNASTDDVGVAGYRLYENGVELATTAATSYQFTGLTCGTSYTLGVAAYDAAGNVSATASTSATTSTCTTSPPASISPPTISGTAQVGQTLTASTGSWSGSPTSYAYQWLRCDASGANCAEIAGATGQSYTLRGAATLVGTSKGSGKGGAGTSFTLARPAGVEAGDLLLLSVGMNGKGTLTPPAGFTLVNDNFSFGAMHLVLMKRIAGASEPASYSFSGSAYLDGGFGLIVLRSATGFAASAVIAGANAATSGTTLSLAGPAWTSAAPAVSLLALSWQPTAASVGWPTGYSSIYDVTDGFQRHSVALSLTAGTPVTSLPARTATLSSSEVIAGNQYAILLNGAGGDQGSTIRVQVTATNSAGSTAATSAQTAVVAAA